MMMPRLDLPHKPKELEWEFDPADWIMSASWLGLIDHHMRVVRRYVDENQERWYLIFDTTLKRGYGDYEWVEAAQLENYARLVQRPDPQFIDAILQRTAMCRGLKYSIPDRLDCESLQRWIHTGCEAFRWCP